MGRPLPGAALEDSADELKGIANYEGTQQQTCRDLVTHCSCISIVLHVLR